MALFICRAVIAPSPPFIDLDLPPFLEVGEHRELISALISLIRDWICGFSLFNLLTPFTKSDTNLHSFPDLLIIYI